MEAIKVLKKMVVVELEDILSKHGRNRADYLIIKSDALPDVAKFFAGYYTSTSGIVTALGQIEEDTSSPLSHDTPSEDAMNFASKFVNQSLLHKLYEPNDKARVEDSNATNTICMHFIQEVQKAKGVFQQFAVDDKGRTLMACFGLPPWSFEKDAIHALKAVSSFAASIEKMGISPLPIAVASGELLYSVLGSSNRKDASLLGDVVNLAARLLNVSEQQGVIVCDENTFEAAKEDVRLKFQGQFEIKGNANKVNVYVVSGDTNERQTNLKSTIGLTQATEIENWTPFFALQAPFATILRALEPHLSVGRSMASLSTVTRSSTGPMHSPTVRTSRFSVTDSDELDVQIFQQLLKIIDEDPGYYPLFSAVLPMKAMEETVNLEGLARNAMLKKFLVKIFQYASHMYHMMFIFDDVQWADPASMEIILSIATECPMVGLMFFTRPIGDIEIPYMSKISKLPKSIRFVLNGLSKSEVSEMILLRLKNDGVMTVEDMLLSAIFEHSKGHPLKVDMTLGALYTDYSNSALEVSSTGELRAKDVETIVDSVQSIESSNAAFLQFERLDATFKDFLRKTSIIGQYFNLSDYELAFGQLPFTNREELHNWITEMDKYNFLVWHQKDRASDDLYFNHITVMKSIYDSQSYEERASLHLQLAKQFERLITDQNMDALLPTVAYHYSKTSEVIKKIKYLESLGYLNYRKNHYRECQNTLETLCNFIEQNEIRLTLSEEELASVFDTTRFADWYGHMANVAAQLKQMHKVEVFSLKALQLTGITLPTDDILK
ncbi:hypothetical protein HDV05_002874 [Chytridiales sp. JEL 0842]|nr:hypothetical protein HDV05_002874 [Chytridiales sp. JEL 0842]